MSRRGSWLIEIRGLLLLVLAAGSIGWAFGYVPEAVAVALVVLMGYWLYQILRIRDWLADPSVDPPESTGLWGALFDQIFRLRQQNLEAQQQLQSTVDYLRDSFMSIRDGVVMVDADGAIDWMNLAAQRLLGLQFPRDRGRPLLNLIRQPQFKEYFQQSDFQSPLEIELGDGSERHVRIEVTHFGFGDRLVFFRDVTSIVRVDQMRRDFVGNVSHELRTPLTVIKGYLDMLSARPDIESLNLDRPVDQMIQQADRMEDLLKDLLWLSRIESVRTEEKTADVNMPALLEEIADELGHVYPGRIHLDITSSAGIVGDYRELHSAVTNLALNALKYSAESEPVTLHWSESDRAHVLEVRDRGIGIDSLHLPRITERFYRIDESRSSQSGGTGLGLAIVKHVAAAHSAELRIDSELGKGSLFSLIFPVSAH